MLRRIQFALLALVAAALLSPTQARVGEWKIIGSDAISFQNHSATIAVGRRNGPVSKLQLRAWGKPVYLRRMTIVYGNGDEHNISMGDVIDAGGASRTIDVKGGRRFIKEIRIRYRATNSRGFRRSLIEVYGMEAAPSRPTQRLGSEWRSVARVSVSTRDRSATIQLNQRMDQIAVRILDRALDVRRIRIHFGNGSRQTIAVGEVMFDGDQTQSVHLDGGLRRVTRVVVELRPHNRRRNARIEILAHGRAAELPPIADGWTSIARARIDLQNGRFEFPIGQRKGLFRSLRIRNRDHAVLIRNIRIVFGNGATQVVRLGRRLGGGEQTGIIDLDGNVRLIDRIIVRTQSQRRPRTTRLEIIGRIGRRPLRPIPRGWKSLAIKNVDLRDNRFRVDVGRDRGPIRRINLRSRDNPVFIRRITIVFGNGDRQRVRIGRNMEPGEEVGIIDLDGNQRFIHHVIVQARGQDRRRFTRLEMIGETGRIAPRHRLPPPRGWRVVGTNNVDLRNNRLVIPVGRDQGAMRAINLRNWDNAIATRRVTIVFGNGSSQTLRTRARIPAGGQTGVIELAGGYRFVRQVIVTAEGINRRRMTRLEVIGQMRARSPARPQGGHRGEWISMGRHRADMFKPTVSTYEIGRDKGRFHMIRLRVLKHDVKIKSVRVVFGNGQEQDIPIRGRIHDGAYSNEIALNNHRGRGRFVQAVVVRHKSRINFKGPGATEVWLRR